MRWRTANNRARAPRAVCKRRGHSIDFGYGLTFGGGPGTYEFCTRCGTLVDKVLDAGDDE